jgi:putative membrane protein
MKPFIKTSSWLRFLGSATIAAALVVCAAQAADTDSTTANNDQTGNADATSFLNEAIEGNSSEIALAEIAQRKAQNSQVKQLASMIHKDHEKANKQLKPIAQAHGVSINETLDSKDHSTLERFQKLSGTEFDKAYVTDMLKDHQKDIGKYQTAARTLQETDLKNYAQNTLPTLQKHLQHAKQAAQAIGMDQSAISSIINKTPGAVGGTSDNTEIQTGAGTK